LKINRRTPVNKRSRKPKGQSRMDNPETLATLETQDTGRRQPTQNNSNNTENEKEEQ